MSIDKPTVVLKVFWILWANSV